MDFWAQITPKPDPLLGAPPPGSIFGVGTIWGGPGPFGGHLQTKVRVVPSKSTFWGENQPSQNLPKTPRAWSQIFSRAPGFIFWDIFRQGPFSIFGLWKMGTTVWDQKMKLVDNLRVWASQFIKSPIFKTIMFLVLV